MARAAEEGSRADASRRVRVQLGAFQCVGFPALGVVGTSPLIPRLQPAGGDLLRALRSAACIFALGNPYLG